MARLSDIALRVSVSAGVVVCLVASLTAAPRVRPIRKLALDRQARRVDLFDGMQSGVLSVRVVPRNELSSRVFITNTGDRPLTVKLPKAVAAVHVLRQQLPIASDTPLSTAIGQTTGTQTGNSQGVAGQLNPFGQQNFPSGNNSLFGPGNGNPFTGNGLFSIPPAKVVELQLKSVCLDYGKPTPNSKKIYVLVPLQKRVSNRSLRHLLQSTDFRRTDRKTVQAAVWHLSNGLSWQTLARKKVSRARSLGRPLFSRSQLRDAWNLVVVSREKTPTTPEPRTGNTRLARNRR